MIYYFSGTGNSRWIAEELARRIGDEEQNIAALQKDESKTTIAAKGDTVGIVFPVYAWGAPLIVEAFCKRLSIAPETFTYAVCTCGDEAGLSMQRLKKFFAFQSAWSLAMPNNYIIGYDVDNTELEQKKISLAKEKLPVIAEGILSHKNVYDVHEGKSAALKTALIRPLFNRFARATSHFSADANCNSCGLCARVCPIGAISMQGDKPVWVKAQCTQCMGCINRCPQRAIQYGSTTATHGRYYMKSEAKS